jgi:hypothetical protein
MSSGVEGVKLTSQNPTTLLGTKDVAKPIVYVYPQRYVSHIFWIHVCCTLLYTRALFAPAKLSNKACIHKVHPVLNIPPYNII